jgi:sugar-specific transcriptional regulator TrmB
MENSNTQTDANITKTDIQITEKPSSNKTENPVKITPKKVLKLDETILENALNSLKKEPSQQDILLKNSDSIIQKFNDGFSVQQILDSLKQHGFDKISFRFLRENVLKIEKKSISKSDENQHQNDVENEVDPRQLNLDFNQ